MLCSKRFLTDSFPRFQCINQWMPHEMYRKLVFLLIKIFFEGKDHK